MPRVQTAEPNQKLKRLGPGEIGKAQDQVILKIEHVNDVMRDQNNIIIDDDYRLDSRPVTKTENGHQAGDFKVDIQTVTRQKNLSETVAEAFVSPRTPQSSLRDLQEALNECLNNQTIFRVT